MLGRSPETSGSPAILPSGRDACLACLYLPREAQKSEDELVSIAIRMPDRQLQVRQLIVHG
jgi:hypothetical protein